VLATKNGDVAVYSVRDIKARTRVYNFSVDATPSYFAGDIQLWVHNASYHPCRRLQGNGQTLAGNLNDDPLAHRRGSGTVDAHHAVPSVLVTDPYLDDFFEAARDAGYDINASSNGILLPNTQALADELGLPRHAAHPDYTEYMRDRLSEALLEFDDLDFPIVDLEDSLAIREAIERVQAEVIDDIRNGRIGIMNGQVPEI